MKFPVSECKYCGETLFYRKQIMKGKEVVYFYGNGTLADNSGMYDCLDYIIQKSFYCSGCEKYLFSEKDIKESDIL